jgi:hypothetical protein
MEQTRTLFLVDDIKGTNHSEQQQGKNKWYELF